MRFKYDYLVIGAGFYGSVFAREATEAGYKCLVIDKRPHFGGNAYCEQIEGINVHKYGAHIFHTDDKNIWDYVNQFAEFNRYTNSPLANSDGELYNLPFNMNTFYKLWGTRSPDEARQRIQNQVKELNIGEPKNLEEQALKLVGYDIYHKFIKTYTEKQWAMKATELPAFIIKRIPIRFNFDNNYFNDRYQGIPIGGYNQIFERLLASVDVKLGVDYFQNRKELDLLAKKKVFTGRIDQFFDFEYGKLEYRSLNFESEILDVANFQGNAVINFMDRDVAFTRIIEHKHFEFGNQPKTVITKEFPMKETDDTEPYYPINDKKNMTTLEAYKRLSALRPDVIFGGRLAEYRYYDMHQVIAAALSRIKKELALIKK